MPLRPIEGRSRARDILPIACVVFAMAAAILVIASPTARVIAKWACDPIAHATSCGAVLFALFFFAASGIALRRREGHLTEPSGRKLATTLLMALVIGNGANLAAHVGALRSLNLPLSVPIYQWNGADNTYSYLFHSHAGKAALTDMLAPLAAPLGLDIGQGWGHELPVWTAPVCGSALVVALLSYVVLLRRLATRFDSNPWVLILFGLAVLNAAKAIIDGGLLTYRVPPALIATAALAFSADLPSLRRRSAYWLGLGAVVLGLYAWLWMRLSPSDAWDPFIAFVQFGALLGIAAICADKIRSPLRVAGLAALLLIVAAGYGQDAMQGTGRLLSVLPGDYRAIVIDFATLQVQEFAVGGRRPLEIYRQFGDDPLKPKHVLLASATVGTAPATFPFAVLSGAARDSSGPRIAPWRLRAASVQSRRPDLRLLAIDADTDLLRGGFVGSDYFARGNYYCLLHGFAAQLRAAGLQTFTMIPLRNHVDRDILMSSAGRQLVALRRASQG